MLYQKINVLKIKVSIYEDIETRMRLEIIILQINK